MQAFRLKDGVTFAGGSVAIDADGRTFDIAAALEEGGGVITTENERLAAYLASTDVFVKASPDDSVVQPKPESREDQLSAMTKAELVQHAETVGVENPGSLNKSDLVTAILDAED